MRTTAKMNEKIKAIVDHWELVKQDRAAQRQRLEHTGPGESPFSREENEFYSLREHQLQRLLVEAIEELEPLLKIATMLDPKYVDLNQPMTLAKLEELKIRAAMAKGGLTKEKLAEELGIDAATLYRKWKLLTK